jgi:hypothetical protein
MAYSVLSIVQSDRKTALSALPNEGSTNVVACVSGIIRISDRSGSVRLKG